MAVAPLRRSADF